MDRFCLGIFCLLGTFVVTRCQGGGFAFDEMFGENAQDFCIDFAGQQVSPGATYQPGADPCMECVCGGGGGGGDEEDDMNMCMTVQCAQPTCANYELVPDSCCDYTCPDDVSEESNETPENVLQGEPLSYTELIEPCCNIGKKWFIESREQCGAFPTAVRGVVQQDQGRCLEFVHLCCIQERKKRECEKGRATARIERSCEVLVSQQYKEDQKSCCSCCLLGIDASSAGVSCDLFSYRFPSTCADTFKTCCHESNAEKTTSPIIVTEPPPPAEGLCARFLGQLCGDICIDVPGSYRCDCRPGFLLQADGRTCQQEVIDRCLINDPCDHVCEDTGYSVACRCFEGYALQRDEQTCLDIDECSDGSFVCLEHQTCVNTEGSYTCIGLSGPRSTPPPPHITCSRGFAYNQYTHQCEDIDECAISRSTCAPDEDCVNTAGSFRCDSRRTVGGLNCGTGFRFDVNLNRCQDVNECALGTDTCQAWQTCVNSIGSFSCRRTMNCGTGYTLDEATQDCIDIDECLLRTDNCPATEECRNIPGSFRCLPKGCPIGYRMNDATGACEAIVCDRGYKADAIGMCVDVNECAARNPCRSTQTCVNTQGSFVCRDIQQCGPGFELNAISSRCEDIDECTRGTHDCTAPHMRCENRPGSYLCTCPPGYELNQLVRGCEDIDECNARYGQVCDLNSRCDNTQGSFVCSCNAGFQREGDYCIDQNECERDGMCMHSCRNTYGSFQCSCNQGYELAADGRSCEDIDECRQWEVQGGKLCFGDCRNTMGSYECQCPQGYNMDPDGRSCRDINECQTGQANCFGGDKHCINTRGSFKCETVTCPRGFLRSVQPQSRSNAIRCQRQSFLCAQGDTECLYAPVSLSYNFITFPSNIRIPADLFTMRGPQSHHRRLRFELELKSAADPVTGQSRVTADHFRLESPSEFETLVKIVKDIEGPQDIELHLKMHIHSREFNEDDAIFFGTALAIINVYVTEGGFK